MLTNVFTKSIRDRWMAVAIAAVAVGIWLPMAMAIYSDIDISIYTDLPEGVRELMGIPDGADSATLAYNVMLDFAAALALAGVAVSIGASAFAGEERNGTMGLLLANPKTRIYVLVSKLAAMVVLITAAAVFLWGVAELAPVLLGIDIGATHLAAMLSHLWVNALFYGMLALAVGAWTGNRTLASAVPAGTMVISYFAVGLIPLIEPIAGAAKALPWFYFSGSQPLQNGVNWTHMAVLGGGVVAFATTAIVGVERRDLRSKNVSTSLLDRLREDPRTRRVFERLAGSTRVSRIWIKTTSEHQALLFIVAGVMFFVMGLLMGPMYTAIEADIATMGEEFPAALLALAGDGDLSTPEGWFTVESFSLTAPIAVMILTVTIGARSVAGEEANRTMGLLLANPIKRSQVVLEKALAMSVYAIVLGVVIFAGAAGGNLISSLGMSYANVAATAALVTLLGLAFGALALALSAATGRTRIATVATIGVAATSHLLNSFLPLSDRLAAWARITPHHYFLSSDPLNNGMNWGHAAVLTTLTVVLVGAAVAAFDSRDIRNA